jgi:hypothetical protein
VALTTVLGRMARNDRLPEELRVPFDQVLEAFRV